MNNQTITFKEAAKIIGTKPAYLRVMQGRGQLKTAQKNGRDWFMQKSEAEDLARERIQG